MILTNLKNMELEINNDLKESPYFDNNISLDENINENSFIINADIAEIDTGNIIWIKTYIFSKMMIDLEKILLSKCGRWIKSNERDFYNNIEELLKHKFLVSSEYSKNYEILLKDNKVLRNEFINKYEQSIEFDNSVFNKYMPLSFININNKLKINIDVELLLFGEIIIKNIDANKFMDLESHLSSSINNGTIPIKVIYRFKEVCEQNSLIYCCNDD